MTTRLSYTTLFVLAATILLVAQGPWRTPPGTNGEVRIASTNADALCVGATTTAPASSACTGGIYAGPIIATTLTLPAPASYVPVWGNTGTANTLGNGTLTGSVKSVGPVVFFSVSLTWGSTTVSGNGAWTFTTPSTTSFFSNNHGGGLANDAGTASYHVNLWMDATTYFTTSYGNPRVGLAATVPFTWTTTDGLFFSGWYFQS